ncbi:MAG: hypothetical protein JO353_08090 [Phycisphaerae bacterium]|nr:hypothetical protein [Phycisphaerae bacterium]
MGTLLGFILCVIMLTSATAPLALLPHRSGNGSILAVLVEWVGRSFSPATQRVFVRQTCAVCLMRLSRNSPDRPAAAPSRAPPTLHHPMDALSDRHERS